MTTFSSTYDTATPDGDADSPAEADDRIQEIKSAVQERENVDHYWPKTGTEVSDADTGEHRKLTLRTLSAAAVAALTSAKAYLYRLVTDGELYFKDASDNTIQLTSGGKILSASLDMKDQDNMSSNSASHAATQKSIKAYADAVAAAAAAALAAQVPGDIRIKGWVCFDGTGTLSVKDSYNVSSVTDNGTGDYTVNWDTNFADANYCAVATSSQLHTQIVAKAAGTTQVRTYNVSGTLTNDDDVSVIAIGDQ